MVKNTGDRFFDVLFYGVVFLLIYLVFRIFQPFLVPLGWASVFAVIFYSANQELEQRIGRTAAAWFSTASVALILIAPVLLVTMLFIREGIDASHNLQGSIATGQFGRLNHAWDWLVSRVGEYSNVDLGVLARQGASKAGQYLGSQLGAIIRNIIIFFFELFVTLFAMFFCFRDGDLIIARVRSLLPFEESIQDRMLSEARELIFASVTSSLVIAVVQGLICGTAFAIVGIGSPIFWGVLMAFLSLLPVIGSWPVWVIAAIWLFATGHVGRGLLLLAICGGLGSTIDNILRPIIIGGRASLNGLMVFISVLGGIAVFGVLGIVLGPIVVATAVGVLDVYSEDQMKRKSQPTVPS